MTRVPPLRHGHLDPAIQFLRVTAARPVRMETQQPGQLSLDRPVKPGDDRQAGSGIAREAGPPSPVRHHPGDDRGGRPRSRLETPPGITPASPRTAILSWPGSTGPSRPCGAGSTSGWRIGAAVLVSHDCEQRLADADGLPRLSQLDQQGSGRSPRGGDASHLRPRWFPSDRHGNVRRPRCHGKPDRRSEDPRVRRVRRAGRALLRQQPERQPHLIHRAGVRPRDRARPASPDAGRIRRVQAAGKPDRARGEAPAPGGVSRAC
jgi:hypothetical protein